MKTLLFYLLFAVTLSAQTFPNYRESLIAFEGYRVGPYRDSDGTLSVGIGHSLNGQPVKSSYSREEIEQFFNHDLAISLAAAHRFLPNFDSYPEGVKQIVIHLAFTTGPSGLMKFKNLQIALKHHSYVLAASELGHSKWYNQVNWKRANWAWNTLKSQAK